MHVQLTTFPGASIPSEAMMHFLPPVSDFPPVAENFLTPWKISQILPFSRKNFRFSSAKISDDLFSLVINHKFRISPYFRYLDTFPHYFEKIILSPYFYKFPSVFGKFTCFLHTLCVFRFTLLLP